jgi:acyl-CoA synthetase (AMP-forming)/AMP-acid ligase II
MPPPCAIPPGQQESLRGWPTLIERSSSISYAISLPDNFSLSRHDCILPAMSMFHANAWGLPHAAVMNGSRLVLPGPNLQPERLLDLLSREEIIRP